MKIRDLALVALGLLAWAGWAEAAGTVIVSRDVLPNRAAEIVTFDWTADGSDGSVPVTATPFEVTGWVALAVTDPGSPAPTDNYDVELPDSDGADIFGGELLNRDTAVSEQAAPLVGSGGAPRFATGPMTLKVTNNLVAGARGRVKIYVAR